MVICRCSFEQLPHIENILFSLENVWPVSIPPFEIDCEGIIYHYHMIKDKDGYYRITTND